MARVARAEEEVLYGIKRTYFLVLYAREQDRVAQGLVRHLDNIRSIAQQGVDAGSRDVTTNDVNRAVAYLRLAQVKQIEAAQGVKRPPRHCARQSERALRSVSKWPLAASSPRP